MISENPPKWTDTDRWDVADETVPKPYGASGDNIADAWIKRYRDTLKYLSVETDKACARLVFTLRYSLAHRIVELACQEAGDEPGHLSLALTHWTHVLREMAAADTGARFIAWLTDPKAEFQRDLIERRMRSEDVAEAEARAQQWLNKFFFGNSST